MGSRDDAARRTPAQAHAVISRAFPLFVSKQSTAIPGLSTNHSIAIYIIS